MYGIGPASWVTWVGEELLATQNMKTTLIKL